MAWWDLPIRSGRASASGTSFWYDRPGEPISASARLTSEELDVALVDAMCASSKGVNKGNVSTWDRIIGGPIGGGLVSTDTQFDWRPGTEFGFGKAIEHLPTGGIWATDGSGWLVWVIQTIPATEATSAGSSPIWTDIIAGNHDAKYVKFGERIVTKMVASGHPLKRLIIDANHEMNQSNHHRVYASTRFNYKAAMERTFTKIREGADNITPGSGAILKFMHRPASRVDPGEVNVGPYIDYVPSNVDVVSLSIHPDGSVNTSAKVDQFFDGTLNSEWYGMDEMLAASVTLNKPIAFPEWAPRWETTSNNGGACPIANTFVQKFFDQMIELNRTKMVCDCVHDQNIRDTNAYTAGDAGGIAQWSAMVATRKSLWLGTQSDSTVPTTDSFTYTVRDDWGSRTASVAVTVQGGAVLFVTASDDGATTAPGTAVVIPVLTNDDASASLLPLEVELGSVSSPSPSGTAVITTAGDKIRYTPASGVSGVEATFSYRAKPSNAATPTSTATVRVQILTVDPPAPTGGDFPALGGSNLKLEVNNAGAFNAIYASAKPGDHVVVASGLSFSSLNLNRPGVVVRAGSNQGVTINGNIDVNGSNQWLYGFKARSFSLTGANNVTFRRMHFDNNPGSEYLSGRMETNDSNWQYCTFSNSPGGLRFSANNLRNKLQFCHWFNITGSVNATEALIIMEGGGTHNTIGGYLVEDCLFENTNLGGSENESISCKCGGNIFRRIHFDRSRFMNSRYGKGNLFEECRVQASTNNGISLRGPDHRVVNCVGPIVCYDGNWNSTGGSPGNGPKPNALDCTIIGGPSSGADGTVELGHSGYNIPADGIRIEGRGTNPDVKNTQGGKNPPTIIPNTSVPDRTAVSFPLGRQHLNPEVGVQGGV